MPGLFSFSKLAIKHPQVAFLCCFVHCSGMSAENQDSNGAIHYLCSKSTSLLFSSLSRSSCRLKRGVSTPDGSGSWSSFCSGGVEAPGDGSINVGASEICDSSVAFACCSLGASLCRLLSCSSRRRATSISTALEIWHG